MAKKPLGVDKMGIQKTMRTTDYLADCGGQFALNAMTGLVSAVLYFYTEKVGVAAATAANVLLAYDWPGNVRELENCVKHALTFWQGGEITPHELPTRIVEHQPSAEALGAGVAANASLKTFLKQKEKEYIGQILNASGGDKEKAAETLKVNLSTLYRKLSEER